MSSWRLVAQHLAAIRRANGLRFTRWAAAIGLFGYLSLFPLATLAFVVLTAVLARVPEFEEEVQQVISDALPGLLGTAGDVSVDLSGVARTTVSAGIVGVVLLLVSGLGWVDATVEGTRRMLGALRRPRNFLLLRLEDVGWLLILGLLLLSALVASIGLRAAGHELLGLIGLDLESTGLVRVFADLLAVALVFITLVVLYGFAWRRPQRQWRQVLAAAIMASVVLHLMSQFIYLIVGRTLNNPVYGTLAVAAALLLFLYLASAVMLYFTAWLAVVEGQPPPVEEEAYYARLTGGQATLP